MTPPKRLDIVPQMSNVSTDTQAAPKFNSEAFAMNIARAMESSGQALAAYLKPRQTGEVRRGKHVISIAHGITRRRTG